MDHISSSPADCTGASSDPFSSELTVVVSRIVFRAEVLQSRRPHRGYLCDVLAGFRPVEMGRVSRENDYGARRIGFQLARVELIAQPDIEDTGNNGIDSIFRVFVRH